MRPFPIAPRITLFGASRRPSSSARWARVDRDARGWARRGDGDDERRERPRRERRASLEFREPALPVRRDEGGAGELVERHREHLGLERDTELAGASDDAAECFVEDLD